MPVSETGQFGLSPDGEEIAILSDSLVIVAEIRLTSIVAPAGLEVYVAKPGLVFPALAAIVGKNIGDPAEIT